MRNCGHQAAVNGRGGVARAGTTAGVDAAQDGSQAAQPVRTLLAEIMTIHPDTVSGWLSPCRLPDLAVQGMLRVLEAPVVS